MKLLMQLALVFLICLLGEVVAAILPFPFPASVISMILVFLVLFSGILKVAHISTPAEFMLGNMAFFFIGPAVSIFDNLQYLEGKLAIILLICFVTTILTFIITAYTVSAAVRWEEKWRKRGRKHA